MNFPSPPSPAHPPLPAPFCLVSALSSVRPTILLCHFHARANAVWRGRQLEVWLVRISLPRSPSLSLLLSLFHSVSAASFCLFVLAQCVKVNLVKSLLFIISLPSSSASLALFELATCQPHPLPPTAASSPSGSERASEYENIIAYFPAPGKICTKTARSGQNWAASELKT